MMVHIQGHTRSFDYIAYMGYRGGGIYKALRRPIPQSSSNETLGFRV